MWSSRLFWKVFAAFVGLILISSILFGVLITGRQEQQVRNRFVNQVRVSAVMLAQVVEDAFASERMDRLQGLIRTLGERTQTRLTVVAPDGLVLADSDKLTSAEVVGIENHADRPELVAAMETGGGQSERYSTTLKTNLVYYAVRVDRDGQPIALARASLPDEHLQLHFDRVRQLVWLFASIVTLVAIAGSYALVARIIHPLMSVTRAAEQIADGELDLSIDVVNRDEIGVLANAFNRMTRELSSRIAQLRDRGDQLAAVLGGMTEGVIAVDGRAHILFANDSAGHLFDFDSNAAVGRSLLTTIRDETLHRSVRMTINTGQTTVSEIELRGPVAGYLTVHAAPLPGDPCPGVVLVLNDVTDLRRLESVRRDFVANVSHELKTPLSAIKAYAETLREGAIFDQDNNVKFVQRIEDQADRLHRLILDLLSLARIDSDQQTYEIAEVRIEEVAKATLEHHAATAAAKSISLLIAPGSADLSVRADDEAMRQILDNLVNNAIKYTSEGGRVTVRWRPDLGFAVIEVVDTGIGIAPDDQDHLFERFYRVDKARSRELGGTGLGLSIVKHLAQFFGGNVWVESTPGEGSIFSVRLPRASGT